NLHPLHVADGLLQVRLLIVLGEEPDALVVLLEELDLANGVGVGEAILHGDVEEVLQELQLAVDGGRSDLLDALGDVPLDVAGKNLAKAAAGEGGLPVPPIPLVLPVAAQPALHAVEVVVDDVGQEDVPPADPFREEAALLHLVLSLLIDLRGQALRPDLLTLLPAGLVDAARPPRA